MKNYVIALMGVAAMAASCNNEMDMDVVEQSGEIAFTAQVNNQAATRMTGTAWELDDAIGVKVGNVTKEYKISDAGTGAMTTTDPNPFLWNNESVEVKAWYPYNKGDIRLTDQSTEPLRVACDVLTSTATADEKACTLKFKHAMTQVLYMLQYAEGGYTEDEKKAATVTFFGYETMNCNTGEIVVTGEPTHETTPLVTSTDGSNIDGKLLMVPCDMLDKKFIKVVIAGNTFIYTPKATDEDHDTKKQNLLVAGATQKYYLKVDKKRLDVKMEFTAGNITNFGIAENGDEMKNSDKGLVEALPEENQQ